MNNKDIELEVYCYNWEIRKESVESKNPDRIYAWCLNRKAEPHLLRIENQPTSFVLQLPEQINSNKIDWSTGYTKILEYIKWRIKVSRSKHDITHSYPIHHVFSYKKLLCLYQGKKTHPTLTLVFNNSAQKYTVSGYFKNPIKIQGISKVKTEYKCLEVGINIVRAYMTRMNCQYSQWFRVKARNVKNKVSYLKHEYIVNLIKPIAESETRLWNLDGQPGIFTFDLECKPDGDRMPEAHFIGDQIFSISCMYTRYMSKERRIVNLLLGQAPAPEDEEIRCFKSEKELLEGFYDLIAETDPEILTGYNIYGFDYPYLWDRTQRRQCQINPKASRLLRQPIYMPPENKWFSKGYGYKQIKQIIMGGRIDIDVIFHVRANYKLKCNKLDFAARAILGTGKYDLSYLEMFEKYDRYLMLKYSNKYKLKTFTKQDFSNAMNGLNKIVEYNSVDTKITYDIFNKTGLFTTLKEVSNITGINIVNVLNRGQQIRGISTIYNVCRKFNIIMNKTRIGTDLEFTGGFVFEPKVGLWKHVICIDFSSLYPSIIIANNISHDTLLLEKDWDKVPIEQCNVIKWTEEKSGRKCEFRYVKKEIKEGVLPYLLKNILAKRSQVKKEMAVEEDPSIKSVLNKKQLALKICANSIYGLTGINEKMGKISLKAISISVTACGRNYIKHSAKYVEEVIKGNVIYGDTDSIMFTVPGVTDSKEVIRTGRKLAKEISKLYPKPVKFEFEKAGKILITIKKMYVFWKYHDDETKDNFGQFRDLYKDPNALERRGNVLVRRDNYEWCRKCYRELLFNILLEKPILSAYDNLMTESLNLIEGKIKIDDLIIYKSMGSGYKNDKYPLAIFLECLKKRGRYLLPGERFGFLLMDVSNSTKASNKKVYIGEKMRLIEEYNDAQVLGKGEDMRIDYLYYFSLIAKKNIDQLWLSGYQSLLRPFHLEMTKRRYKNVIEACLRYDTEGEVESMLENCDYNYQRVFEMMKVYIKDINRDSSSAQRLIKRIYEKVRKEENISGRVKDKIKTDIMYVTKTIFKAYKKGGIDKLKETIAKIRQIIVKVE